MKKHFVVFAAVMIACVLCMSWGTCFAAMRNLMDEFKTAVDAGDLEKVDALIKEGLQVNDTVAIVCLKAIFDPAVKVDFMISLIKRLAEAKADFKYVFKIKTEYSAFINKGTNYLSTRVLKAFLEAGADPNEWGHMIDKAGKNSPLFEELEKGSPNPERIKLLVDHKASMTQGIIGFRDQAMRYFLEHQKLESTSNLTEGRLKNIVNVLEILRKGGADKSEAKKYLKELRDKHRNVPDALKYIDKIEEAVNGSGSWCSIGNLGIFALGLTALFFVI